MTTPLQTLLDNPSPESWAAIVEIGKKAWGQTRIDEQVWTYFVDRVSPAVAKWPPEIERLCPAGWPRDVKDALEHRVLETDTYAHYIAKICGDPALRLFDGSQAVWLERRFTGGVVPVSTAQQAQRVLARMSSEFTVQSLHQLAQQARNILANGVRNVGKVGCADLTGGLTVELEGAEGAYCKHEYRLEVEIKVGKQQQDPAQVVRMNSVRARGGCYVLARSVDEAVAGIIAFRDSR